MGLDLVRSQRTVAAAAELVVADRGHQVDLGSRTGERHGLVGGRPARGDHDPGRGIAARVERANGRTTTSTMTSPTTTTTGRVESRSRADGGSAPGGHHAWAA